MIFSLILSLGVVYAQNPYELVADACPGIWEKCLKRAGSDMNWLNGDNSEEEINKIAKKAVKCLVKPGNAAAIAAEPGDDYATCEEYVGYTQFVQSSSVKNTDPKCGASCQGTFAKCYDAVGYTMFTLPSSELPAYNQCVYDEAKTEPGCCECEGTCPELTEGDAEQICSDASGGTKDDCKNALNSHYGYCKFKGVDCVLKKFWKGNCVGLKKRHCKVAVANFGCEYAEPEWTCQERTLIQH